MPLPNTEHLTVSSTDARTRPMQSPWGNLSLLTLALCAALGASTSLVAGATTGIGLLLILTCSALLFAAIRSSLPPVLQAAAFVVIFTGGVTVLDLLLRAWGADVYREVGVFLPLAVAAGPLLANTEMFSPGSMKTASLTRAVIVGVVFACGATLLGGARELVGSGFWTERGFLLALLPPGALIGMAVLMAAWNFFAERGPDS